MLKSMPTVKRTTRRRVAAEVLTLGLIAAFIVPMATFAGKGGGSAVTPWIGLDGVQQTIPAHGSLGIRTWATG